MTTRVQRATPLPHSWPVSDWPHDIYPNRANTAKYIVRAYRDELLAVGALTRVGRQLVVLGEGYGRFLARHTQRVPGYEFGGKTRSTLEPKAATDVA